MSRLRRPLRWLLRHWYLVPIAALAAGLVVGAWLWAGNQAAGRKARGDLIVRQGEALIAQNNRIVECTTPGMVCFEEAQRRNRQTLGSAFVEIDCILRRAVVGLPASDPRQGACQGQTPPDVYPGRPGG